MDNICIQKIWEDNDFFELRVEAQNEFVNVYQTCYSQENKTKQISSDAIEYLNGEGTHHYFEFGEKNENCTPAFSIDIVSKDVYGHFLLELDMEINDKKTRSHRCKFFVKSEWGCVERFFNQLHDIANYEIGEEIVLNER